MKVVAAVHVSNALGTINPIEEIVRRAHDAGAIVVVDGAQAVPQLPVDLRALDADFYGWTGHKAYGPTGVGVLHGRAELLAAMPPFITGGHMIASVSIEETRWAQSPAKFEAGTSNIAEAIGLGAAVDFLQGIGMEHVRDHERELVGYALERLGAIPGLTSTARPTRRSAGRSSPLPWTASIPTTWPRSSAARGSACAPGTTGSAADAPPRRGRHVPRVLRRAQHPRGRRRAHRRACAGQGGLRLMDDLYREEILEHYKRPHNWGPMEEPDLSSPTTTPCAGTS